MYDPKWKKTVEIESGGYDAEFAVCDVEGEVLLDIDCNSCDNTFVDSLSFDDAAKLLETLAEAVEFMASYQALKGE